MRKETLEEIGQKISGMILIIFVVTSLFLLLKHLIISTLKIIAMYYIGEILKIARIIGL